MKRLTSFLSLLIATGIVAACSGKPGPMPRGYSSYNEPYKSAPGEKAKDIGYDFSAEKNQSVLQDMRYAAQDLVERLDERLAFDTDEIYLAAPANNVFYKSFDHLLRAELVHRGYTLALTPENLTRVDFGVLENVKECEKRPVIESDSKTPYRTAFLQLAINLGQSEETETVDGFYEVPLYGYKQSNAYDVIVPNCAAENVSDKIEQPEAVEAIKLTK